MKTIYIILALILIGCGTSRDIKKFKKFKSKLETKGIVVPRDTIIEVKHDTIIESYTVNDTTYIVKTVTKTVQLEPIIEVKTKWQTKIEYKEKIKYIKGEVVKVKEKTKQVKAENRKSKWYIWLLIGLGLGVMLKKILS